PSTGGPGAARPSRVPDSRVERTPIEALTPPPTPRLSRPVRIVGTVPGPIPDRVREARQTLHYSRRTGKAHVYWGRRYLLFHKPREASAMGADEIRAFLVSAGPRRPSRARARDAPGTTSRAT